MTATPQALNLWTLPLRGSQLIEASAGTGKTWTLSALVVRLVLGQGGPHDFARPLLPSEILVMTFTRAATRELTDRIRARLLQAARVLRDEPEAPALRARDGFLAQLSARYPEPDARSQAAWRLATAADAMDEAAIFTLDAWCQRVLREHAFDSGQLFDETLVPDEQALLSQAVHDHWRRHVYPLSPDALAALQAACPAFAGVEALRADVDALRREPVPLDSPWPPDQLDQPLAPVLAQALAQRRQALAALQAEHLPGVQALHEWVAEQTATLKGHWDGRRFAARHVTGWTGALLAWAQGQTDAPTLTDTARERLTPDGLQSARKADAPALVLPGPVAQALADLARLDARLAALPSVAAPARAHALHHVGQRLAWLKAQRGEFGFADLQQRLDAALARPGSGERLRHHVCSRYPVALIDEFQDTSPLQYRLLDRLYDVGANHPDTALLLIGDPKQSIYRFRGADIDSYLHARRATEGRHHVLDTNHRSSAALVAAVNHLFGGRETQSPGGAFFMGGGNELAPGHDTTPLPFWPVRAQGRPEAWCVGDATAPPALTLVHDLTLASADAHRRAFAERCAEQVVAWLSDPGTGFARPEGDSAHGTGEGWQRLRPGDIAILVRTGVEAATVRRALHRRGVASVYLSDRDSVFRSAEATDLLHWLHAVAQPRDVRLARAAWGTRLAARTLTELNQLAQDDDALDARMADLARLHTVWRQRGVLALLRQTLFALDLPARWLAEPDGERRLTNLLHLGELLQAAATDLDGEAALIRWLLTQTRADTVEGDEPVVRLESDSHLVQVITIHKSKGLEYPVVCLPFATLFRPADSQPSQARRLGLEGGWQLTLTPNADDQALAEDERLREDLRLLYVALTRARHALWVGFGRTGSERSQTDTTHRSALGHLVAGRGPDATEDPAAFWLHQLQALLAGQAALVLAEADPAPRLTPWRADASTAALQPARTVAHPFETDWGVGSFSALVRDLRDGREAHIGRLPPAAEPSPLLPLPPQPAADEDSQENVPFTISKREEFASVLEVTPSAIQHRFQRGVQAGNFLHAQLEWLAEEQFALAQRPDLAQRLQRRCERAGHGHQAEALVHWLARLCEHPLTGVGASLSGLDRHLPEMAFWLPVQRLRAATVGELCRVHLLAPLAQAAGAPQLAASDAVPPLPERTLHGMLMGFADLVFEHQGRCWVLDHKSNHLGADDAAYTPAAMTAEMARHRYDVQAGLYLLALHRLLRSRLGAAYRPAQHLGGAVYLFLRGLDGPGRGACHLPVPQALLDGLDQALEASP